VTQLYVVVVGLAECLMFMKHTVSAAVSE